MRDTWLLAVLVSILSTLMTGCSTRPREALIEPTYAVTPPAVAAVETDGK